MNIVIFSPVPQPVLRSEIYLLISMFYLIIILGNKRLGTRLHGRKFLFPSSTYLMFLFVKDYNNA